MTPGDVSAFRDAVRRIDAAIQAEEKEIDEPPVFDPSFDPCITVTLSGYEIGVMRRMLANIELTKMPSSVDEEKLDTLIDQYADGN
jgi:hypothetical protein